MSAIDAKSEIGDNLALKQLVSRKITPPQAAPGYEYCILSLYIGDYYRYVELAREPSLPIPITQ
jgi:hypothetical protein